MGLWTILSGLNGWPVQISLGDRCVQIDDGSVNGKKCQLQIFRDITPVLTIGDVSPDYRCHQYSNLTYPLGIGPLGCEYSTLLYSSSTICV